MAANEKMWPISNVMLNPGHARGGTIAIDIGTLQKYQPHLTAHEEAVADALHILGVDYVITTDRW